MTLAALSDSQKSKGMAVCGADFHRWRYTIAFQDNGKLYVAHQIIFVEVLEQFFLALFLTQQMVFNKITIQLQHRLSEHAHSQINQAQLNSGEASRHCVKQFPRKGNVILTVVTISF